MPYPSVSLIIPCFNESARIPLLFDGLQSFVDRWQGKCEFILVDDGSTDHTAAMIVAHDFFKDYHAREQIFLIQQSNTGKGGALQAGIARARGEFVLTLDADMATSPLELCHWLAQKNVFSDNEILIASRELKTSSVKDSAKRKFVGHIFNFIIRHAVGLDQQDTQCGFKLYPSAIARQLFASLQTPGWAHDVEILLKAKQAGYRITEMPVKWEAIPGSKVNIVRDGWQMFWEVMKIRKLVHRAS